MSLETWKAKYPVYANDHFDNLTLRQVVTLRKEQEPQPAIWSARLSTGIFGLTNCPSGNSSYAPKGENEVLLTFGDMGLEQLIDLGFVPCPACHPENTHDFWSKVDGPIKNKYPILVDSKQILDRNLVPFDATRLDWEKVASFVPKMPSRIYTQPNLDEGVIRKFKKKIEDLGFLLPPIGFYDRTSPTRFTEYIIKP